MLPTHQQWNENVAPPSRFGAPPLDPPNTAYRHFVNAHQSAFAQRTVARPTEIQQQSVVTSTAYVEPMFAPSPGKDDIGRLCMEFNDMSASPTAPVLGEVMSSLSSFRPAQSRRATMAEHSVYNASDFSMSPASLARDDHTEEADAIRFEELDSDDTMTVRAFPYSREGSDDRQYSRVSIMSMGD